MEVDPAIVSAVEFSIRRCLERSGVTLAAPAANHLDALATYWAEATRLVGEDIALQVAAEIPIGALGLASYGMISASTLGAAIEILGARLDHMVQGMSLRLLELPNELVEVRIHGEGHPLMPVVEEVILARVRAHTKLLVAAPTIHAVSLRRAAPPVTKPWQLFFGAPTRFGQRHSMLRLGARDLQIALRTASPALQASVRAAVAVPNDTSMSARIRAYVRAHARDAIEPAVVARTLEVTPRTLQRRLQAEHTSLRALVTEVRIALAKEMLAHTEATVAEIAAAVGFSRPASFSRAFVATTSETAQAFRKRHQD
jgi:AraC-like DNA-binding protein